MSLQPPRPEFDVRVDFAEPSNEDYEEMDDLKILDDEQQAQARAEQSADGSGNDSGGASEGESHGLRRLRSHRLFSHLRPTASATDIRNFSRNSDRDVESGGGQQLQPPRPASSGAGHFLNSVIPDQLTNQLRSISSFIHYRPDPYAEPTDDDPDVPPRLPTFHHSPSPESQAHHSHSHSHHATHHSHSGFQRPRLPSSVSAPHIGLSYTDPEGNVHDASHLDVPFPPVQSHSPGPGHSHSHHGLNGKVSSMESLGSQIHGSSAARGTGGGDAIGTGGSRPDSALSNASVAPVSFQDLLGIYSVVAERRSAFDNLLWQASLWGLLPNLPARPLTMTPPRSQVPAMSLTGHAFLFSIALDSQTSQTARIISMALSLIITILTLQLFTRQLQAEDADHAWLRDFEERHFVNIQDRAHGAAWAKYRRVRPKGAGMLGFLADFRGFSVWSKGLLSIGGVAIGVLLAAAIDPDLLIGVCVNAPNSN